MMIDIGIPIYLCLLSYFDIKERKVPTGLVIIGLCIALIWIIYEILQGQMLRGFMGLVPGTILLLVAWFSKKAGLADGLILILVGALKGYAVSMLIFGISLVLIALFSGILLCMKKATRNTKIPYIPFLCGGYFLWITLIG